MFPYMEVHNETHLTDEQQRIWIDDIVLPSLRESCSVDVLQHHPRIFADASTKAYVQREFLLTAAPNTPMDIRYTVPEGSLEALWNALQHRCGKAVYTHFRGAFLIVSGHDLKLHSKHADRRTAESVIWSSLNADLILTTSSFLPKTAGWTMGWRTRQRREGTDTVPLHSCASHPALRPGASGSPAGRVIVPALTFSVITGF